VRQWVLRSLLRQGIWGSGLDTLLTRLRGAIKAHGANGFPVAEIELTMGEIGKSLAFDEVAVQGLLQIKYGDRNCLPLLSLIYPSGDSARRQVDHVFPQTAFTRKKLEGLGVPPEQIEPMTAAAQEIPNLQLLTPADNESKGSRFPEAWLVSAFPEETTRAAVCAFHHLGEISDSLDDFGDWFAARRGMLAAVIRARLGVVSEPPIPLDVSIPAE
jgi:hypothetical protein